MRRKLMAAAVLFFLWMTGTGCGNDKTAYFEMPETADVAETEWALEYEDEASAGQDSGNTGNGSGTSAGQSSGNTGNDGGTLTGQDSGNIGNGGETSADQNSGNTGNDSRTSAGKNSGSTGSDSTALTNQSTEQDICYVYVCGAVKEPGVYELEAGARIYEAVDAAGGLTEEADFSSVNQAEKVSDGQMVKILTKEEAEALGETPDSVETPDSGNGETAVSGNAETEQDGRININLASAEELMTLPGIGRAKADSIISYRESSGGFSSIEEIMQVEGIKEGVFNRVKDSIKVK